jgi:hypothetical protein
MYAETHKLFFQCNTVFECLPARLGYPDVDVGDRGITGVVERKRENVGNPVVA